MIFQIIFWIKKRRIIDRCPFCEKGVWFSKQENFFEITSDWGCFAHEDCYTKKNAEEYIDKWLKECEKEADLCQVILK